MKSDGNKLISMFKFLTANPKRLEERAVEKKKSQCPVNTLIKSPDGWYYIVDSSTYKKKVNNYWLFLRPFIAPESCFGISLFESHLSEKGYQIVKKGVHA